MKKTYTKIYKKRGRVQERERERERERKAETRYQEDNLFIVENSL